MRERIAKTIRRPAEILRVIELPSMSDSSRATPNPAITNLLHAWAEGDPSAFDRLTPLVLHELKRIAHRQMRAEHGGGTLQTTALVNEAWLRLVDVRNVNW